MFENRTSSSKVCSTVNCKRKERKVENVWRLLAGSGSLGDCSHGLGQVTNIAGGDSGDRDPAVLGEVDTEVLGDLRHLVWGHSSEGEHSNLVGDMFPVAAWSWTNKSSFYVDFAKKY